MFSAETELGVTLAFHCLRLLPLDSSFGGSSLSFPDLKSRVLPGALTDARVYLDSK